MVAINSYDLFDNGTRLSGREGESPRNRNRDGQRKTSRVYDHVSLCPELAPLGWELPSHACGLPVS
jgi:hypothetical protein